MLLPTCSISVLVQISFLFRLSKVEQDCSPNTRIHMYINKPCVDSRKRMWPFAERASTFSSATCAGELQTSRESWWHRRHFFASGKAWYYWVRLELPFLHRFQSLGILQAGECCFNTLSMALQTAGYGIPAVFLIKAECLAL